MAYPSTEINDFRAQVERLVDSLRRINAVIAIVEDQGADDAARQAFFSGEFGEGTNNPDITFAEFGQGVAAARNIRTAWEANKLALAKLLP